MNIEELFRSTGGTDTGKAVSNAKSDSFDGDVDLDLIVKFAEIEKKAELVKEEIASSSNFSVEELVDFFLSLHPDKTIMKFYSHNEALAHREPLFVEIRKELIKLINDRRCEDDEKNSLTRTSKKTLKPHTLRYATKQPIFRIIRTERVLSIDGYPAVKIPFVYPCNHMLNNLCKISVSYIVWKTHDCPEIFCTSCGNYTND